MNICSVAVLELPAKQPTADLANPTVNVKLVDI